MVEGVACKSQPGGLKYKVMLSIHYSILTYDRRKTDHLGFSMGEQNPGLSQREDRMMKTFLGISQGDQGRNL